VSDRTPSPDAFYWFCNDSEDITRYRLGEYHPVKLGDCFSSFPADRLSNPFSLVPHYRVLYKLGYGSYATIWLARDLLPPGCVYGIFVFNDTYLSFFSRFVALKIAVANTEEDSCKATILKYLTVNDTGIGSRHIVKLLDNFRIQGPNGSHNVFVTEVLVPLTALARYPIYEKVR
jgi:serine/threonine-protein kinase SRPK3